MCQVFMLTKTKNIVGFNRALHTIADALLSTQTDGFGYAVLGTEGMYGERTTRPMFLSRIDKEDRTISLPIYEITSNSFGKKSENLGAGIFHGRISTNHKTLINTHPINRNGWSLIHNGVVNNHGAKYDNKTSNDTEHLVHYLSTEGMSAIEKNISGYYAFGALDPMGNLHIAKDLYAGLFVAWSKELDSHIFATTEQLIVDICEELKWDYGPIEKVSSNIYMIFNQSGEMTECTTISPLGFSHNESKYSSKSLGYDIEGYSSAYSNGVEDIGRESVWDWDAEKQRAWDKAAKFPKVQSEDLTKDKIDSYDAFLDECLLIDESYTVYDVDGRQMHIYEFKKLEDHQKFQCTVVRYDGTVCSPTDYWTDELPDVG